MCTLGLLKSAYFGILVHTVHWYGPAEECQQSVLWWKGGVPTPHGIATMSCFVCVLQRGTRAPLLGFIDVYYLDH